MKRKIVLVTLSLVLALGLCACGKKEVTEQVTENVQETVEQAETKQEETKELENPFSNAISFQTKDIDGNSVDDSILNQAKVVMVNFWEPWCGPCVSEMPDLEKIYKSYEDRGLLVIGAFTTTDMTSEAKEIMEQAGITYPVIVAPESMYSLMTEYVPTTVFMDSYGNIISKEPIIGSNSYENWAQVVESYLN